MITAEAARDRLRRRFGEAVTSAYDINDALSAFWSYAMPLAVAELNTAAASSGKRPTSTNLILLKELDRKSFDRGGLLADEIPQLTKLASGFARSGFAFFGDILSNLISTIHEVVENSPKISYCQGRTQPVSCQQCGETWRYYVWDIVNTKRRPDLIRAAADGRLTSPAHCYTCDSEFGRSSFFYCNPDREEFIVFWPYGDDPNREKAVETFWKCLEEMPVEMRGGKDTIVAISGVPAVIFKENNVAAITVIETDEEFLATVNDPMEFYSEPGPNNLSRFGEEEVAQQHIRNQNWRAAMRALSRSFLAEQVRVSLLDNIVTCLWNLGRRDEAETMAVEATRLREALVQNGIIHRILRHSLGSPADPPVLYEMLTNGLPAVWGFSDLIVNLRRIAKSSP